MKWRQREETSQDVVVSVGAVIYDAHMTLVGDFVSLRADLFFCLLDKILQQIGEVHVLVSACSVNDAYLQVQAKSLEIIHFVRLLAFWMMHYLCFIQNVGWN